MPLFPAKIQWHDLRMDPDDIPEPHEEVLITKESYDGSRRVVANVYLVFLENDDYCWCTLTKDIHTGRMEETMLWETVVAWAYYPSAYSIY